MTDPEPGFEPPASIALALAELAASITDLVDARLVAHGLIPPIAPRPRLYAVPPPDEPPPDVA
jgi:hypothetical protein